MAKEILGVPEEHLATFIKVVRAGLERVEVPNDMREGLEEWCREEEEYLADQGSDDEDEEESGE